MSNFDFLGKFLGSKAQLQKDGHDMSNMEALSLPFGVNVPVTMYHVVPNEHYRVQFRGNTQTAPMREDNFAQIYANSKAVFVPITSLVHDYASASLDTVSVRKNGLYPNALFPYVWLDKLLCTYFPFYVAMRTCQALISCVPDYDSYFLEDGINDFVKSTEAGDVSLKEVIQYEYYSTPTEEMLKDDKFFASVFLNYIMADATRYAGCPLSEYISLIRDCVSPSGLNPAMDFLRIMDNLGYGNFYPFYEHLLNHFEYNLLSRFVEFQNSSLFFYNGFVGENYFLPYHRSIDLLAVFAFQYFIQLTERSNYRNADVALVTPDSIASLYNDGSPTSDYRLTFSFRDYGVGIFDVPTAAKIWDTIKLSRDVDFHNIYCDFTAPRNWTNQTLFVYLFSLSNPKLPSDLFTTQQSKVVSGDIPSVSTSDLNANLVQTIADTSALYKLRQQLLRAGVRRDKQMQAIFGVSGDSDLVDNIMILDSSSSQVNISGLMNQAETSEAPLGARAARGDGGFALDFTFDSKEFGFLFIVQSFTCSVFYESFMIDRSLTLSPDSWFNPIFNHLGLEPVRQENCCIYNQSSSAKVDIYSPDLTAVTGYSSRFWQLKQRVNKLHGAFTNFGMPIPSTSLSQLYPSARLVRGNAAFGGFVPSVIDQQIDGFETRQSLYYSPYMVNNIFVNMVDGGIYGDYSFDQFRNCYFFKVHKVSPMPKIGLLKLDV